MNSLLKEIGKFFIPFLKPYKNKMALLAVLPIIWCLVETAAPYLIKIIIDQLALSGFQVDMLVNTLVYLLLAYACLILILEFSTRLSNYVWIKTFPQIRADIQKNVLEQVQTLSFQFLQDHFAGDLISKYSTLTESFEKIFSMLLYGFYPTILSFLFALIFIFFISPLFAGVFLFWFLFMGLVTLFYFKKSILFSKEKSKVQNNLYGYVGNFICNPLSFIMFSQNLTQEKRFHKLIQHSIAFTEKLEFVTFKADLWRSLFSWLLLVCMMVSLSYGWTHGSITLGDFAFIGTVCFYIRRSIWMMSIQLLDFFKELGTTHEALSLISNAQNSRGESSPNASLPATNNLKNSLEFEDIHFNYGDKHTVFNNLNLQIPAGQKLGISGPSGAGKTSLIHLLLGLYEPLQGTIKFGGRDLRSIPIEERRNLFSYASQNAFLLHRSVYDNIAFGNPNASQADVYEAAKICLCDEFISSLNMGYDTVIGEGGYKLSGGQRQRIAIARAYIKKAPIFILDEATSGLEASLEERLLDSLCQALKTHTFIVVSHRISRLMKMDRVIELKKGCVAHTGISFNFEEILTPCSEFSRWLL
jgi:ATP-binding cassette subfamily B protein